jgi:hypothetical protein
MHNVTPILPPPGTAWISAIWSGSDMLVLIDQPVRILIAGRQQLSDFIVYMLEAGALHSS